jgi:predicted secreted protein
VTQAGTPFSVENMNKIEQGIFDAHEDIAALIAGQPFGYLMEFEFEPTALELANWRCLPLGGQLILISQYQRLCDRKYVGNGNNATADWWYKCDSAGNRDVNGTYMRVLDHRGLFSRAVGANSLYRMANDTPS